MVLGDSAYNISTSVLFHTTSMKAKTRKNTVLMYPNEYLLKKPLGQCIGLQDAASSRLAGMHDYSCACGSIGEEPTHWTNSEEQETYVAVSSRRLKSTLKVVTQYLMAGEKLRNCAQSMFELCC